MGDDVNDHRFDYHTLKARGVRAPLTDRSPAEGPVVVGISDKPASQEASREAVVFAARLASQSATEVILVHALPLGVELVRDVTTVAFTPWRRNLQETLVHEWCEPLDQIGVAYRVLLVERPVATALIGVAEHYHASRIVLGAPGHAGRGLGAGGVAEHVRRRAPCPVVTVPAAPAEGQVLP